MLRARRLGVRDDGWFVRYPEVAGNERTYVLGMYRSPRWLRMIFRLVGNDD